MPNKQTIFNSTTVALLFVLFSIAGCQLKDRYYIQSYQVRKIKMVNQQGQYLVGACADSIEGETARYGIGIKLVKEYHSDNNSRRFILGGGIEPGQNGIDRKIRDFEIYKFSTRYLTLLNDSLYVYRLENSNSNIYNAVPGTTCDSISLTAYIAGINSNHKFAKGTRLDKDEMYFWYANNSLSPADSILLLYNDGRQVGRDTIH